MLLARARSSDRDRIGGSDAAADQSSGRQGRAEGDSWECDGTRKRRLVVRAELVKHSSSGTEEQDGGEGELGNWGSGGATLSDSAQRSPDGRKDGGRGEVLRERPAVKPTSGTVVRCNFIQTGASVISVRVQCPGNKLVTGEISYMGARKQNIRVFTEDEIEIITNSYSTPIGRGGFGEVFRGVLDGDNDLVAVKRYIRKDLKKEFMEEVRIHSQMSHKNVAKLIGYCIGESTLILVTEYVSRGNLDHMLHCSDIPIPLDIRLGIAIGCAEALGYMHSMHLLSDNLVYHGDIKPANILLDDNLTTKVSDFGLSRLLFGGITQFTNTLKGSIGYTDPVYFHEGCLTPRSDVYSFGVVLLELISRKRVKQGESNLIQRFSKAGVKDKSLKELFDAEIADESNMKILKEMRKLALECLTLQMSARPQMNDVAKRLRTLRKDLKDCPKSILATHTVWRKPDKQGTGSFKKSLSFFKGSATSSNSKILSELGDNVRIFTMEELDEVTQNYSYLLGGGTSSDVYKGTLEDNTQVVVRKLLYKDSKEAFINRGVILSQIVHKNIIKLLGCCLEADTLVFVYEYVRKGRLLDVLAGQDDLPLDLRIRIAIKVAEALEFLHSPATGVIGHGRVSPSNILLDDNFAPKLADFSAAWKLIKADSEAPAGGDGGVVSASLLESILCSDQSRYESVLMNLESDVYRFGCVLLSLISRDTNSDHRDLVAKFTRAYEKDRSGQAAFDKTVAAEDDVRVMEEVGRLALRCTVLNVDEMPKRPTMSEVVEELRALRRSWRKQGRLTRAVAAQAVEAGAAPAVPAKQRLPNLMRHLYGYRRISVDDPAHV